MNTTMQTKKAPLSPTYYDAIRNMTQEQMALFLTSLCLADISDTTEMGMDTTDTMESNIRYAMTATVNTNDPDMDGIERQMMRRLSDRCTFLLADTSAHAVMSLSEKEVETIRSLMSQTEPDPTAEDTVSILWSKRQGYHNKYHINLEIARDNIIGNTFAQMSLYYHENYITTVGPFHEIEGYHVLDALNIAFELQVVIKNKKPLKPCPNGTIMLKHHTEMFTSYADITISDGKIKNIIKELRPPYNSCWMIVVPQFKIGDSLSNDMMQELLSCNGQGGNETLFIPA